jgi:shikimate dehydrogenase
MNDSGIKLRTGLIGADIQSSRSPVMHMAEARALGLDLSYDLFDFDKIEGGPAALSRVLNRVQDEGYLGVNITYPVKQTVISLLDECSDDVGALGACNTVVLRGGRKVGHNTDWFGFAESFRRGLPGAALDRVLLLGAGGAGSAVAYALLKLGARRVAVHETDGPKAAAFVERFNLLAGEAVFSRAQSLEAEAAAAGGLINCTPVGMSKLKGVPIAPSLLRPAMWVADVVYVPLRTELLRQAAAKGCRTLEGGGMAVFQAGEALRLFTGRTPDFERMLRKFRADVEAEKAAG